ncbi:MAG TPA: 23S rRNA (uracil(1939)-C(5))-methyltransferase RlmD [Terracidiphilus sp.]|jgi:23S rRNA (uracil1939-C5)-methyltransferase
MKRDDISTAKYPADQSVLVQIEKPIYGGSFLARLEGKAVFVPLTLPGEQARVRIVEEKKSYASAEPEAIVIAASNRVEPGCRHFGVCGGCQYQHADYETQLAFKHAILRETLERGGAQAPEKIEILAGDPWNYRNRIRLAVDAAGRVGYRERRSHATVPISECPIAAPTLVAAAFSAAEVLRALNPKLNPTEISLFCNANETELLATLFVQHRSRRSIDRFAEELKDRVPALTGVQLIAFDRSGHAAEIIAEWGSRSLTYRVGGIDYQVGNGAFFQVNRWLLDKFADRVTAGRSGAIAWDLFAGVGLFARRLADGFKEVIAVESAPASTQALAANLERGPGKGVEADVAAFLKSKNARSKPDLIVVDPPRTGLGSEVTSLLANVGARTIVYVSCDPATLARDLRVMITAGYAVSSITLADLFPQTFHLETVVELQRS